MTAEDNERYSRQLVLKHFGEKAQAKLASAAVLVVGAGGLGCPALQYLTAAGAGTIGLADGDTVSLSNLQRQVLYSTGSVGRLKTEVALEQLSGLNPGVNFQAWPFYLDQGNALEVISKYDLVIDGTDNFRARYLVNDACVLLGKPLIHGSVSGFEGQLAVFNFGPGVQTNYRDLFPVMPAEGEAGNCAERGVLGVLPGIIGTMQAAEAIKIISGTGETLANTLLTFNLLRNEWLKLAITPAKRPQENMPLDEKEFLAASYETAVACAAGYRDIGPEEFDELLVQDDVLVIDVREKGEYPGINEFEHINIPVNELQQKAAAIHRRKIVLFCHSGIRSVSAASFFPADNTIYNLKGGIIKWMHAKRLQRS